jgi:hypothetical protein
MLKDFMASLFYNCALLSFSATKLRIASKMLQMLQNNAANASK